MNIADQIRAVLIGVDEAVAAILFKGQTDLTISARCGMAIIDAQQGVPCTLESRALCALGAELNRIDAGHCNSAVLGDDERAAHIRVVLAPYLAVLYAKGST